MTIGEAVSAAMANIKNEKGMSAREITDDTNICHDTVIKIINGITKYPNIRIIHEFCCGAGYTLEEFFARKEFDDLE